VLVSNHHVLPTVESARSSVVEFNVETTWDRLDLKPVAVDLDPDAGFATPPKRLRCGVAGVAAPSPAFGGLSQRKRRIGTKTRKLVHEPAYRWLDR
jgi:hypothetical protein